MVLAAVAKLGRYTRFVPHSVMIGFLSGVSANIFLGQLPHLLGAEATGPFALAKALDLLLHPGRISPAALSAGLFALGVLVIFRHTGMAAYSALIALVVPSVVVAVLPVGPVPVAGDGGTIPSGLPLPALPRLADFSVSLLAGAFAVAAVVLVQGAGVSETAPNPDKTRSDANRDFLAADGAEPGRRSGRPGRRRLLRPLDGRPAVPGTLRGQVSHLIWIGTVPGPVRIAGLVVAGILAQILSRWNALPTLA